MTSHGEKWENVTLPGTITIRRICLNIHFKSSSACYRIIENTYKRSSSYFSYKRVPHVRTAFNGTGLSFLGSEI